MAKDDIEREEGDEPDELTRIENALKGSAFDEAAIRRMIQENPDGAADALIAFARSRDEATTTLLGRQKRQDLDGYKKGLLEEFPYADPDLISGTTKKEIRRSAEKVHKNVERVLAAAGIKPGEKPTPTEEAPKGRAADPAQWGNPPAGATEVVREAPGMASEAIRRAALKVGGPDADAQHDEVLRNIAENGPRVINRPTLAGAMAARAAKS